MYITHTGLHTDAYTYIYVNKNTHMYMDVYVYVRSWIVSRDSSVGIETDYGLEGRGWIP
jgi:hypothetical protein